MALVLKNNAVSRLASPVAVGDTSLQLTATEGSRFPLLAAGDWFPVTVLRSTGALEIMRCTARAGDALTVTRAQEGTAALTFEAGDRVELRMTAGAFSTLSAELQQQVDAFIPPYAGAGKALTTNAANDGAEWSEVVTPSGEQTLENKTLTSPTINGGSVSGASRVSSAQFIDKTVTNAAATGTVTLDLSQAGVFNLTLAGATTLAISNAPALSGETFAFVVRATQPATAYSLAWFAGITWLTPNGAAPAAPAAGKSAEYVFSTTDGTNFIGRTGAAN